MSDGKKWIKLSEHLNLFRIEYSDTSHEYMLGMQTNAFDTKYLFLMSR